MRRIRLAFSRPLCRATVICAVESITPALMGASHGSCGPT
jgi:hypothetical protein